MSNTIPYDVVVDILSGLPVKSLLRFKSVSKSWRSLISDPKFSILQYNRTAKSSPQKILISTRSLFQLLDCSTNPFGHERALRKLDFPINLPDCDRIVHVIGSCNGLVCVSLYSCEKIFIWNPSTGTSRQLPNHGSTYYCYGFVYDSLTKNYKVILGFETNKVHIFTTETNSWRRVHLPQYNLHRILFHWRQPRGILVNGSLHWLTHKNNLRGKEITAFDLAEEKLSKLPLPSAFCQLWPLTASLGDVDGCLCLIIENSFLNYELWMMQEHGVQASWKKLHEMENLYEDSTMVQLCYKRSNEVILMINDEKELIRCNLNGNTKPEAFKVSEKLEATAYTESLM